MFIILVDNKTPQIQCTAQQIVVSQVCLTVLPVWHVHACIREIAL